MDLRRYVIGALVAVAVIPMLLGIFAVAEARLGLGASAWTGAFTTILTLATVGLLIATHASAKSTRVAAEQAKQNTLHQISIERPYVFFATTEKGKRPETNNRFNVIWTNTGRTPALITGVRVSLKVANQPPLPRFADPVPMPAGAFIPPGMTWRRGRVQIPAGMLELGAGDEGPRLFLTGEITYTDVFGGERRTWFCREFKRGEFVLGDHVARELNGFE